jgi:hypothetical protein
MSWTKRQLIEEAYDEIGLASYAYDLAPEQLRGALRRLDSMMATWASEGIHLGYPLSANPQDSDLDTNSNLPLNTNSAVYTNLAIKIAPKHGKVLSIETKTSALNGYNALLSTAAVPNEMQLPCNMPSGAGNKGYGINGGDNYLNTPDTSPIRLGNDGQLIFTEL